MFNKINGQKTGNSHVLRSFQVFDSADFINVILLLAIWLQFESCFELSKDGYEYVIVKYSKEQTIFTLAISALSTTFLCPYLHKSAIYLHT